MSSEMSVFFSSAQTSHDERIGEILGYGNGERLESVQDERKALDDHQNEEDAARGDSVGLSDLHNGMVIYDENG